MGHADVTDVKSEVAMVKVQERDNMGLEYAGRINGT